LYLRTDGNHLRSIADRRDRHKIPLHVEGHLLLDKGVNDEIAVEREAERGAVGCGLRDCIYTERAGRAGAVLDHGLLAGRAGDVFGKKPRAEVADAAGRKASNDPYGLCEPVLG
jgi:hypothetical protein